MSPKQDYIELRIREIWESMAQILLIFKVVNYKCDEAEIWMCQFYMWQSWMFLSSNKTQGEKGRADWCKLLSAIVDSEGSGNLPIVGDWLVSKSGQKVLKQ